MQSLKKFKNKKNCPKKTSTHQTTNSAHTNVPTPLPETPDFQDDVSQMTDFSDYCKDSNTIWDQVEDKEPPGYQTRISVRVRTTATDLVRQLVKTAAKLLLSTMKELLTPGL